MRFRDTPIQRKLMLVIMLTSTAVLVLTSAGFIAYELLTFRRSLDSNLATIAQIIADNSSAAVIYRDQGVAKETLAALRAEPHIVAAALYDKEGKLLMTYPDSVPTNSFPVQFGSTRPVLEESHLVLFQPVQQAGITSGMLYLKSDLSGLYDRFQLYGGIVILVMLGSLVGAFGLSSVLQKSISQPILALAQTAKAVSEKRDYSVRAERFSADELGTLTDAFNHMLMQIHERDLALRESSERLHLAMEASQVGIWDWNLINNRITWDDFVHRLYGVKPGDFHGTYQEFLGFVHPQDRAALTHAVNSAIEQMIEFQCEFRILWPDGSAHHIASRGKAFYDENGKALRMTGVNIDLTQSKRAEEAVRESEALLRALVETAVDGIITIDEHGTVRTMNPAAEQIFGYAASEVIGRNVSLLMPEPYHGAPEPYLDSFLQPPQGKPIGAGREVRGRRKNGSLFPVDFAVSETRLADRRVFTGIVRDITERKEAEEEIRRLNAELEQRVLDRTAELAATNRELEAFTYSVSHDLRAPLRHIDAYARILEDEFARELSTEAQRYITRIRHGAQNMGQLVDDLLNLARVGRQELVVQVTGLNSIVDGVIEELRPEAEGREIDWRVGSLPFIECDPGLTKQVFANLLSNALKYTRPREKTVIEVNQLNAAGGEVVLYVRDNGVGFSMKYVGKLFGVFQRLHRQEDFEGTGVGLATVDRIVRKHGGRVWAEAELDKGAAFYFTLSPTAKTASESGLELDHETRRN